MKRKILLISSMLLTFGLITIIIIYNKDNSNNIISNIKKEEPVINSNMITMMYETEAGSGEYIETKDNTWPETGYIFNDILSGCENGGELEYNSGNNTVNLLSNSSDQCYVYFDKYDGVWIDNVSITNVTGSSVTLDVSATSENGSITTYYYALNDSEEYIESTTNPIVINDLNKLTEYKIKIYAIDSTNAKSNIYELTVNTTDESGPIINSVEVSDITYNGFTLTVNTTNDVEISKYYFIIDGDEENNTRASTINTYTFNNLKDNTNYNVLIFVEDANGVYSDIYELSIKTEEMKILLADYIKGLYTLQGSNGIYYHTSSLANSAEDDSYRYSGANPNNYVCFGSDAASCPSDNLYRIIGVFGDEVKLIKNTSYGRYAWESDYSGQGNTWDSSTKPDIRSTLNTTFLNTLSATWQTKIATHAFKVGGMAHSTTNTAKEYYNTEVGSSSSGTLDSMKVGLMYVSDYGFAASTVNWTTSLYDYTNSTNTNNNWMLLGLPEWTISRRSDASRSAFRVEHSGYVGTSNTVSGSYAVRPVFYLTSSTEYLSGSGTSSDPIRIQ